jgi:hypothetical protein
VTQQVVRCVWSFPSVNPQIPTPSVDFVFEATGSETTIDWSDSVNPLYAIDGFWNTPAGGFTSGLGVYFSSEFPGGTGVTTIETYDITAHLDGSPSGSPMRIDSGNLGVTRTGASDLHPALVGVLAYRRTYGSAPEVLGSTRPRARDRGRIHIGPLRNSAMLNGTGQADSGFIGLMKAAANELAHTWNFGAGNQFNWRQWSRKNASVGSIDFLASQYGLGIDRRRVDESNSRVLPWTPTVA